MARRMIINGKNVSIDRYGRQLDSQRKKLYEFEWKFSQANTSYLSKKECQQLANKALRWWNGRMGNNHIEIIFNTQSEYDDRRLSSNANCNRIKLQTEWAMNHYVVLHEVAHVIMDRDNRLKNLSPHGAEFARIMLKLYSRFLKKQEVYFNSEKIIPTYSELRKLAKSHKVKVSGSKLHDKTSIKPKRNI